MIENLAIRQLVWRSASVAESNETEIFVDYLRHQSKVMLRKDAGITADYLIALAHQKNKEYPIVSVGDLRVNLKVEPNSSGEADYFVTTKKVLDQVAVDVDWLRQGRSNSNREIEADQLRIPERTRKEVNPFIGKLLLQGIQLIQIG